MIYIIFGEMGVGKNYIGEKLAEQLGCDFIDGDDVLPQHLKEKVDNFESFTLHEVNSFVRKNLIPHIRFQAESGKDIVVAQALYRSVHRDIISILLDEVTWVYVNAPFFIHMKRLLSRKNGWSWVLLCLMSKPWFQKPHPCWTISSTPNIGISVGK